MKTIAVDLDNTLYDFGDEIREEFFKMSMTRNDKGILKAAYSGYYEWRELSDVLEWPLIEEAIDKVHAAQYFHRPYKHSARVVKRLSSSHQIKYVTSRKEKFADVTLKWLEKEDFPEGGFVCSGSDKGEHLMNCQYLIDDRPKTIIEFLSDHNWEDRKAFGIWSPHNRNLTDVSNVYLAPNWFGLEYYLSRKDVL